MMNDMNSLFFFFSLTSALLLPQPVAKQLAKATGAVDYNILQNNGRPAHQQVDHVSDLPLS